jgi:hypothetical protein
MPSTNGHGPKRAILYVRVSTDDQARSGYSLAQQLEALRGYAARGGYEVLEEIEDKGYSGANLARPGLDRVRDLVAAGGADVVLAQDCDRLARKVVHNGLLEEERTSQAQNPEREMELWVQKIADCAQRRSAYQDQQAAGLMSLEELGSKLRDLDNTRRIAQRELAALKDHRQRVQDLEQDRDALLESMAEMVPEVLDSLTGDEKSRTYRMLRLEATPTTEGYDVSGALCISVTPSG